MHLQKVCDALSVSLTKGWIHISLAEHKLYLFERDHCIRVYDCRLGKNPPSCVENSFGTPLGLHCIEQKIGDQAPSGMVFKGRVATGKTYDTSAGAANDNQVTSRILWLKGLEPNKNAGPGCDSYQRYIYIHGTNQESNFDQAKSHGCILLRNLDVIELYELIEYKSLVFIQ